MFRRLLAPALLLSLVIIAPAAAAVSMPVPGFPGITHWINSPPLDNATLRGKVVLVDFWTFECINCLHALPEVKALEAKYRDRGLVVVGVHTPELANEHDTARLVDAVKRLGITYPVAQDNDYVTWNAWSNRYWPAQYVVGKRGEVVFSHIGEGGYAAIENAIRSQLGLPPL